VHTKLIKTASNDSKQQAVHLMHRVRAMSAPLLSTTEQRKNKGKNFRTTKRLDIDSCRMLRPLISGGYVVCLCIPLYVIIIRLYISLSSKQRTIEPTSDRTFICCHHYQPA